jgi:putative Mg2+ transporter-C (MgtC) family protein
MSHHQLLLVEYVAVGFAISYIFGFERHMRGSPAGDRTFAIIGTSATAVTAVVGHTSPQAVAGVVTGVGFIGAGVVFHREADIIHGLTTAATVFSAAALGVIVGYGDVYLGLMTAALLLLTLELPYIKYLRVLSSDYLLERQEKSAGSRDSNGPTEDNDKDAGLQRG